jgi:voltage-gated potassium channel
VILSRLLTFVFSAPGLRVAIPAAVAGLVAAGLLFAAVEGPSVSAWDGVWWAFTTISTVGYGDVVPRTDVGRVIALAIMVLGVGFLFLLAGSLIERFIATEVRRDLAGIEAPEREILQRLEGVEARLREIDERLGRLEPPRAAKPADETIE